VFIVIQDTPLDVVHAQPVPATTLATLTLELEPTDTDVGDTAKLHGPDCVTVKVCPAIVAVPVRDVEPVFPAIASVTPPLPVPVAPAATVIQDAALLALHEQEPPVVTDTLLVVAADPVDIAVGERL
jgi:hypothetical protein